MASKIQLEGGAFQDSQGNPLAFGYLIFVLSQDAQANSNIEICAGEDIKVNLDANGNISTVTAQTIWPNDALSPNGTFYMVSGYTAQGQLVWGPNAQQVLSTPSPFNVGAWVPGSVNVAASLQGQLTLSQATVFNTATAGTATLPTNPVGFLSVSINGVLYKIPYYAV